MSNLPPVLTDLPPGLLAAATAIWFLWKVARLASELVTVVDALRRTKAVLLGLWHLPCWSLQALTRPCFSSAAAATLAGTRGRPGSSLARGLMLYAPAPL